MSGLNGWTPSEAAIITVLADGLAHERKELYEALDMGGFTDDAARNSFQRVLVTARKKLQQKGESIICEYGGKYGQRHVVKYRHVRLIGSAHE
jgi:hypothetical protein